MQSNGNRSSGKARSGVIAVEVLVATPVFIIMLLAIIEFGLILAQLNQVALASRSAALVASRQTPYDTFDLTAIENAANFQLANIKVNGTPAVASMITFSETVDPPTPTALDEAVTVTVRVNLTSLAPNLLSTFGFDLTGRFVESTTTMAYQP